MFLISKFKVSGPKQCIVLHHLVHLSEFDTMFQFVHSFEFGTVVPTSVYDVDSEAIVFCVWWGRGMGNVTFVVLLH